MLPCRRCRLPALAPFHICRPHYQHHYHYCRGKLTINAGHYNTVLRRQEKLGVGTQPGHSRRSDDQSPPLIYGNFMAKSNGKLMSYNQWNKVLDSVESYMEGLIPDSPPTRPAQTAGFGAWIRSIDEHVKQSKPTAYEFHYSDQTQDSQRRYLREKHHITRLEKWLAIQRQRMGDWLGNNPLASLDDPLPWTVCEIGWTTNQPQRRLDHETHSGSVRIMNLIDSIARVEVGDSFRMQFLSLYPVPFSILASMAEHVLSRLCGSYAGQGGLNVTVAGKSVTAASKVRASVYHVVQGELGPHFELRAAEVMAELEKHLEFATMSARVAKLEEDEKEARDGKLQKQARHAEVEEEYRDAEGRLDDVVDALLAERKARRLRDLTQDVEWVKSYREGLEAVAMLRDDAMEE